MLKLQNGQEVINNYSDETEQENEQCVIDTSKKAMRLKETYRYLTWFNSTLTNCSDSVLLSSLHLHIR